jgi:hypothetical protein
MRYADSVTRSFQSYSSPAWRTAYATAPPNKFLDYQDPTYLGFYVKFYGLGPDGTGERPIGDTGNFVPLDDFPGGLFYNEEHPDSAIRYLKNIGEYTRAQMLREFIMGIKKISEEAPWYFLKVSGLEDSWKINPSDSYRGKEKKITFDMDESIDLKITYLLDLYRKAVYDAAYMRWMLPQNLRTFHMEIVVTEIRSLHVPASVTTNNPQIAENLDENSFANRLGSAPLGNINIPGLAEGAIQSAVSAVVPNTQWSSTLSNALLSTLRKDPGAYADYPTIMRNFDELATFITFSYSHCEFEVFEEAPPFLGTVGKTAEAMAQNKLTIHTPIIHEYNTYGLLGAILEDTVYNTERTQAQADKNFPKGAGGNSIAGSIPDSEKSFLSGIKREVFFESQQFSNQAKLKEENQRLGGILGNLVEGALNVATSAANSAIQGAVSQAILGNVFSNAFQPEVAQDIAKQVTLQAPELIPRLLANVVLEANGVSVEGSVSPAAADLQSPPTTEASPATVTFVAPSTQPVSSTTVELIAPPPGNPSGTSVELSAAPIGPTLSSTVSLSGPAVSLDGNPGETSLEGDGTTEGQGGNVGLEAAPIPTSITGSVDLDGPSITSIGNTKVELSGVSPAPAESGKVELSSPPLSDSGATSVELSSPPVSQTNSGKVDLTAVEPNSGQSTNVELSAPPTGRMESTKVELSGIGTSEGNPGSTELASPPKGSLTAKEVNLEEPPKGSVESSKVQLESANISQGDPGTVELESSPVVNAKPGEVIFVEPIKGSMSSAKVTSPG